MDIEKAKQDILGEDKPKKKRKNLRIDSRLDAMIKAEKFNKQILKMYEMIKHYGARNGYKIPRIFDIVFMEFIENHQKDFPPFREFLERRCEYDL